MKEKKKISPFEYTRDTLHTFSRYHPGTFFNIYHLSFAMQNTRRLLCVLKPEAIEGAF